MPDRFSSSSPILQLDQVSLLDPIGLNYLLENISFTVNRGDRISIVGQSGAGKSTILRLLNRLSEPTTGTIYLENKSILEIPVPQLRKRIVLVLQEPKLLGMTIAQALAYPLFLQQLPKGEIQQRIEDCCSQCNIPNEWLERNELQLSLGQRQIVAIARALIMQPQILLLDEPTSALDAGRAESLLAVLATLDITILMVNHQLEIAEKFSDRLLYLEKGRLQQDTSANNVNWKELRKTIIEADKKSAQEWL